MTRTARSRTARFTYTAVRSEGGLLPHELLEAIGGLSPELGITPTAYFLAEHEPLAEAQSRAWLRLVGLWRAFQAARQALPAGDAGVRLTRERWLLPLFDELGYGRLKVAAPVEVDGRVFAVSHAHGPVPIHLMGAGVDLDRPSAGVVGAAKVSPHGLVQDLLNRSDGHRWGMVTNGLRIRLLRDFHTLTRQAYVDFDLEAIFVGERFADFRLLWLVAHASRLGPAEATPGDPDSAPIEAWFQRARGEGTRALDRLRDGVQTAIERLGSGFLRHPQNHALQEALRSGNLSTHDYYRQLLRLVYRLIFVFVVEDRDVLLPALAADASAAARAAQARYRAHYATTHVRELAQRRRGGAHGDRWQALRLVLGKLYAGCPELGLPALGSYLFSHQAIPDLAAAELQSQDLLAALRALCTFEDGVVRRLVSWRSMGADELGSVYESLLELHPDDVHRESATFTLKTAAGNDRKTTGSYYTPHDLVESLLDSALEPVLTRAAAKSHAEAAILALRVCDPACGSGHFLVAAGRRIAHRLAQVRAADTEPSPQQVRHALRDVYAQCLFGVDLNPMAVELCKVSLWMEAIEPGRPLPFLDSHILQGNALLGATPALIARGLPESAFDALEGDDKEASKRLRKRHRDEFRGKATGVQQGLGFTPVTAAAAIDLTALAREAAAIDSLPDHDLADVEAKAARHRQRLARADQRDGTFIADAYCTAFLWPKDAEHEDSAPTHWLFAAKIRQYPNEAPTATRATVEDLARTYGLFHWHLAFPQVLSTPPPGTKPDNPQCGWDGGFDVVLGNPPWDHVELKEREFFAVLRPDIADAANAAARKKAIKALQTEDPTIHACFSAALRRVNGENLLLRDGGRFPLCGRGRINTYAVFAEHSRDILAPQGQLGIIVPAGIAMDDTTQDFFADLITGQQLVSMYHFENEDLLFLAVHHSYRFVLLTASGSGIATPTPSFAAFARQVAHLRDPERRYTLTADDFDRLNPNTRSFPAFRSRRDATINRAIYRRIPVLLRENREGGDPWSISFRQGTHNMASDSGMFRTREQLEAEDSLLHGNCFVRGSGRMFPLYEAKMIHHFDHRLGTYDGQTEAQANQGTLPALTREQHNNPSFLPLSRYWIPEVEVETRLLELDKPPERRHPWTRGWLLGWRDICRNSDIRTVIPCLIPRTGPQSQQSCRLGRSGQSSRSRGENTN